MKMPVGRPTGRKRDGQPGCSSLRSVRNRAAVDVPHPPSLAEVTNEVRDVALQVHQAEEHKDDRDVVAAAHAGIERLGRRYREMLQALPPAEQMKVERSLGRRLVNLKRLASLLPKVPSGTTESTPDRMAGGGAPGERRITGVSWANQERQTPTGRRGVGGDIEAWCGRCSESRTHSIVAMVGSEPKQVLCQVCGIAPHVPNQSGAPAGSSGGQRHQQRAGRTAAAR